MEFIETVFQSEGLLHDRFFNESFTLPYTFEDIKIQGNELATMRVINDSFDKLYSNFLYLYGLSQMSSNAVPSALSGIAGVSGTNTEINWYPNNTSTLSMRPFLSANADFLDQTVCLATDYSNLNNNNVIVACAQDSITVLTTSLDNSSLSIIASSQRTDVDSDFLFEDIVAVCILNSYVYVLDRTQNNLYRYNIEGLISDPVFVTDLVNDKAIGGYGTFYDKFKFNQPSALCKSDKYIFVLDSGNYAVKVYNQDLNFVTSAHLKQYFINDRAKHIAYDTDTEKLIVLSEGGKVRTFTNDFKLVAEADISSFLVGETVKNIFTPKSFGNCFYVVTTTTVLKFYTSKPGNIIGKFSLYRFGIDMTVESFICAESVADSSGTEDTIYTFMENVFARKLVRLQDAANLLSVLSYDDFTVYTRDEINLSSDEYQQPWVYNKALYKLLQNHLNLKDKIKGRFTGVYDEFKNPILAGTLYFLLEDYDLVAYNISLDHFIGDNEVFASGTINRCLKKIYDIQTSIIAKSDTILQDSSYFAEQVVNII